MSADAVDRLQLDHDDRAYRYFRNAVERHWDPYEVDLSADAEALAAADLEVLDGLRASLGKFGAGEEAVTEDLSPLAVVLEDLADQLFVTTQLYEEAKHTEFFDRYWRSVVHPAEEAHGLAHSSPTDPEWFNDDYDELFERNREAMARLLDGDSPENRARAYCHYHLVVEGVLAQTGYYGLTKVFGGDHVDEGVPHLPGLVDGLANIRSDEGRHVGFGMAKLKELVGAGVDPSLLHEVTGDLLVLVQGAVQPEDPEEDAVLEPEELTAYAAGKHTQRLHQITDASAAIPDVDELTKVEG